MHVNTDNFTDKQKVIFQNISIRSLIKSLYRKIKLIDELLEDNRELSTHNIFLQKQLEKKQEKIQRQKRTINRFKKMHS